ncbi:MAG: hypothetical protein KDD73_06435 [Anaerolineales bacterium]|nr:hypothetical protein [Anaerolineales bacterium]MCB9128489.1 uridylate kinase [Ardenticatenales bacterium]MCB9172671.1 uridylate kinase [Ardenticatenales bacterium]
MEKLFFVKLGGSLLTDKRQRYHVHADHLQRLSAEIAAARRADPSLRLLLGHGSGAFGHVAAAESGYDRTSGHPTPLAMAQVAAAASALNQRVRTALVAAGVPALSLAPSASAWLAQGELVDLAVAPYARALERGLVPLTFGDVALAAEGIGAIASTERLFRRLTATLRPQWVFLLGTVDGVLAGVPTDDHRPPPIPEITPANWQAVRTMLGGSAGTDVTGGMIGKVREMLDLVEACPSVRVRIIDGRVRGLLTELLLNPQQDVGTVIRAE